MQTWRKSGLGAGTPISIPRWEKRADGTREAIVAIVDRNGGIPHQFRLNVDDAGILAAIALSHPGKPKS
jgi:hypothetical protein